MTRRSLLFAAGASQALLAAEDLLVAAASDLSPLEPDLRRLTKGNVRFTFGSSGMLARQIENGAPFDVFCSADAKRAQDLATAGKLTDLRVYAIGRVALWSKSGAWRSLDDLRRRRFQHLAMANPAHAPYGHAARQALERLAPWREWQSRVVLAENVRQAWQFASSGNADVCLTAWSLVHARAGVLVDAAMHDPLRQMGGVVKASKRATQAREFLAALGGEAGQRVLKAGGFELPAAG